MPGRDIPLVKGEIYHILNRGVGGQPIFNNKRDYQRLLGTIIYYQNKNPPLRFSKFLTLPAQERERLFAGVKKEKSIFVEIFGYCLMPNHFHLLLRQTKDAGIAKFAAQFENSYTRYFNIKNKRQGHLFQGKFKAKRIETEEQFMHVLRYIHLNPYSGYVVKKIEEIFTYPYSSITEYLNQESRIINKDFISGSFKSAESFRKFTSSQADYQRKLEVIKHLILENPEHL